MLINRCKDLVLDKFIDCLINGRYECLIVEGNHSEDELIEAWDDIWNEYLTRIDLPNHKYVTEMIRQIALLYLKLNIVEWNTKALTNGYYQECVDALRSIGLNYSFDIEDPIKYAQDIESCIKKSKSWLVEYQQKQKEYDDYKLKAPKEPITEQAFYDQLVTLGKSIGYRLDPKIITVAEYCSTIKEALKNG